MTSRIDFIDKLENMTVNVTSPDGTVQIRLTNREGLSVSLTPQARRQSEQSLGEQVTTAMQGLQSGYRKGFTHIVSSARRDPQPDPPSTHRPPPPDTEAGEHYRRLTEALEELRTEATHGHVRVRMGTYDRVKVRIAAGTLDDPALTDEALADEIRRALVMAHDDLERSKRQVLERLEPTPYL